MNEQALVHVPASSLQGPGHQTALHRAAMVGNSHAICALVKGGCTVDLQNRDGNTALHEVSWHGFSQCAKYLVKAGVDVHIRNKAGNTALHLACQNGHAETARILLLGGSTPDTKNNVGDTCLHVAARYNNQTLVKILLRSLCSVIAQNQAGDTALHVAAALNHKKTVQLLMEAGTDGEIRNNAGKTALDKARDNNHKDLTILLTRAPQVHRFMCGRRIRKWRERLIDERRTQSVTRVEILPDKVDSNFVAEECLSNEHIDSRIALKVDLQPKQQQLQHMSSTAICSPFTPNKKRRVKNQAPASGCHCKPLLKKLEGQVKTTQEEMRLHILTVQEQVASKICKMDQRIRHQEAVTHELTSWWMSHLKDISVHNAANGQYYKLLPSPSADQSDVDTDLESLPLLSVISGDSTASLANYVNILPPKSVYSLRSLVQGQSGTKTYSETRLERSPDDYENTALFPLPDNHVSDIPLGSAASFWPCAGVQASPNTAVVPLNEGDVSSSSSHSSTSDCVRGLILHQELKYDRQHRKHFGAMRSHKCAEIHSDMTRSMVCFTDPTEPTFNHERNSLHAIEVTQRFFDTVSTQFECWYERKLAQVEQQIQLQTQQDRKELLQRISMLEEELQMMMTNENGRKLTSPESDSSRK